ncbi:MAG: acyl carrier protein [Rhodospirillales bacterium]|nr:MAG: acyl carrier protein [Rhodospirillales bacterium]
MVPTAGRRANERGVGDARSSTRIADTGGCLAETAVTESRLDILIETKHVLRDSLKLGDRVHGFDSGTPLFGSLPELDSMAVVTVITALEERFDIVIDDEEISAATFESLGSLSAMIARKLSG